MKDFDELPDRILTVKNRKQAKALTKEIWDHCNLVVTRLTEYQKKQGRDELKAELRELLDLQRKEEW